MTDPRPLAPVLALAGALLASSPAHAVPSEAYGSVSTGYRHSFDLDAGGLSVGAGLGGWVGGFGMEYEAVWSNDRTFSDVEERTAGRSTNWLGLMGRVRLSDQVELVLHGAGGLGWIKPAGPVAESIGRQLSWGVREQLRVRIALPQDDDGLLVALSVRVGAEHLWQDAVVGDLEHGLTAGVALTFGPRWD